MNNPNIQHIIEQEYALPYLRKRSLWDRITPYYTGGSADTVFGVSIYGNRNYDKTWFKYTFRLYHDFLGKVDDVWRYFHYRLFNKIHVVKTDLDPGWYDVDEVMFRACFALLGRFVEKELGKATDDSDNVHYARETYRGYNLHACDGYNERAIDLWIWYCNELPAIIDDYDIDLSEVYSNPLQFEKNEETGLSRIISSRTREPKFPHDYIETIKEEKLQELMIIRRSLWT